MVMQVRGQVLGHLPGCREHIVVLPGRRL